MRYSRVTIKDIARAVGVSPQTVSRVLNSRPDVAIDTRRRVEDAIAHLDYRPSALARSLVQQRSYTLGVVIAGLAYSGPARVLHGIVQQAEAEGYSLLLKELPHFATDHGKLLLNSLHTNHVDGIIWAVPEIGDNLQRVQEHLISNSVPVLFLAIQRHAGLPIVTVDGCRGGRLATEHLLAQGCRQIGHISGPLDWWGALERKRGWQEARTAAGMATTGAHWIEGDWSAASGAQALRELLMVYRELDAVFVANDQMALGVLLEAHRQGIRVPQELAVAGYDNIPEAEYFWPPLTTIQQDQRELGTMAVKELIRLIETSYAGDSVVMSEPVTLMPTLVIRESSQRLL